MAEQLGSGQEPQQNYLTHQPYAGQNQISLRNVAKRAGFKSPFWVTFLQAKQAGLQIKAGMHGTEIYRVFDNVDTDPDTKRQIHQTGVKKYVVFNLDQCQKQADYTINPNQLANGQNSVIALGSGK